MAGHVVKVSVIANTQQFSRAFQGLASATGLDKLANLGKRAAQVFAGVATGVATAAGAFAAKAIGLAGDLEQSTGAVEAVFKTTADQMKDLASTAQTTVGLTKNEYQELATLLGSQLKNGGTAIEELGDKTSGLITLGADLSSMFGGTTADAVAALSSALKGERDPIERYGVTLKQAMIDAKATEMGFADVSSAQAQQAATLALIAEQTADAQGNFARETNTWAHQVQVIKARTADLAAEFGTRLLPAATTIATFVSDRVIPAFSDWALSMADRLGPAIDQITAWIQNTAMPALRDFAAWFTAEALPALSGFASYVTGTLMPGLIGFAQWLIQHRAVLAGIAAPILAIVAAWTAYQRIMTIVRAAQAMMNAVMATGRAIQAAYAFGTYGQVAGNTTLLTTIAGLTGALKTKAAALGAATLAGARQVVSTAASTASLVAHKVAAGASAAAQWLLNAAMSANPIALIVIAIAALVAALIALYNNNETVRAAIDAAWATIRTAIGAVADWITGTAIPGITAALDTLKAIPGRFAEWFGNAKTSALNALTQLLAFVTALPGRIIGGLAALGGMLWSAGAGHFRRLVDGATSGAEGIWSFVSSIPSRISGLLSGLGGLLVSAGSSIISGLLTGITNKFNDVKNFVSGIAGWIRANKGPLDYDRRLLQPAGRAIMAGLATGLSSQLPALEKVLDRITGAIAATSADLAAPTLGLAAQGTGQQAGPTIIVQCLDPTPDVGRRIADALATWQAINGRRP